MNIKFKTSTLHSKLEVAVTIYLKIIWEPQCDVGMMFLPLTKNGQATKIVKKQPALYKTKMRIAANLDFEKDLISN